MTMPTPVRRGTPTTTDPGSHAFLVGMAAGRQIGHVSARFR